MQPNEKAEFMFNTDAVGMPLKVMLRNNIGAYDKNRESQNPAMEALQNHIVRSIAQNNSAFVNEQTRKSMDWMERRRHGKNLGIQE